MLDKASASVREKRYLSAANPGAAGAVDGVLGEVVGSIRSEARNLAGLRLRQDPRRGVVPQRPSWARKRSHSFARERKFEETAVSLALMCRVSIDVVEQALPRSGAEIALEVLAGVAGLSSTTAKAILLLRADRSAWSAQDLDQALTTFSRLQIETARRVLGFYDARRKRTTEPLAMTRAH